MGDMPSPSKSPLVQYILLRSDLKSSLKWSFGAIIAQACHASTAAIHKFYSNQHTQSYLKDLDNMHKIILQVSKDTLFLILFSSLLMM